MTHKNWIALLLTLAALAALVGGCGKSKTVTQIETDPPAEQGTEIPEDTTYDSGACAAFGLQLLEQVLHYAFLISDNAVSRAIAANPGLYVLYAGLAAGLFEETGRFMAFKYLLRRSGGRETAVSYGLGHGGYECLAVSGAAALSQISATVTLWHRGAAAHNSFISCSGRLSKPYTYKCFPFRNPLFPS